MSVQKTSYTSRLKNCNDIREAKAYISYVAYQQTRLNKLSENIIQLKDFEDIKAISVSTNDLIGGMLANKIRFDVESELGISKEKFEDYLAKMFHHKDSLILPETELRWLKDDEVSCYWLWLILNEEYNHFNIGFDINFIHLNAVKKVCKYINHDPSPSDSKGRYTNILGAFDSWCILLDAKLNLIQQLKKLWIVNQEKVKKLGWIKKDNQVQSLFVLEYMLEYQSMFRLKNLNLSLTTHKERYLAINAFYYYWEVVPELKVLFSMLAQKSWHQKTYRDRKQKKEMKAINTFISKESKEKMDFILTEKNMKINELIEMLVGVEFELIRKTK